MQGYKIQFNAYANSQEEADKASKAIADFVDQMARQGVAVTADKMAEAVSVWGNNIMVKNYFSKQ